MHNIKFAPRGQATSTREKRTAGLASSSFFLLSYYKLTLECGSQLKYFPISYNCFQLTFLPSVSYVFCYLVLFLLNSCCCSNPRFSIFPSSPPGLQQNSCLMADGLKYHRREILCGSLILGLCTGQRTKWTSFIPQSSREEGSFK